MHIAVLRAHQRVFHLQTTALSGAAHERGQCTLAADADFFVEASTPHPEHMALGEASGSRSAEVSVLVDNDDMEEEDIGERWALAVCVLVFMG